MIGRQWYNIQERIHEWAEHVFGSATRINPLYKRIREEFDELDDEIAMASFEGNLSEIRTNPKLVSSIAKEAADVAITLFRFCGVLGIDLLDEVEKKQSINEERKWEAHGDGTGHHVKNL